MKDALNFDLHYIYLERWHGSRFRTIPPVRALMHPDVPARRPGRSGHRLVPVAARPDRPRPRLARLFDLAPVQDRRRSAQRALSKRRWRLLPGATYLLNRSDAVVVHNDTLLETVKAQGILSPPVVVLNDQPPPVRTATAHPGGGRPL